MPSLVLDTNIALLFIIGSTDKEIICRHKRLQQFDKKDFEILCLYINQFDSLKTSPNILTEVSNLASQIGEPDKTRILEKIAEIIPRLEENYIESGEAVKLPNNYFSRLGLTDTSNLLLQSGDDVLLTDDASQIFCAYEMGKSAENFNHIRDQLRADFH